MADLVDPLTAALNLAIAIIGLWSRVWDATPAADRAALAADIAHSVRNCAEFLLAVQSRINASVPATKP